MFRKILFTAICVAVAAPVAAQTCSSPILINSNNANGNYAPSGATTCGAANPIPEFPGSISSPQPDIVYSFVANSANATITLDATGSPLYPGIVVMDACSSSANIIGAPATGGAGASISTTVSGLTDGNTYYVVVTTGPGEGAPDDNCGAFAGDITGTLPVALKKFSVN